MLEPEFTVRAANARAVTCACVLLLSEDEQYLATGDSAGDLSLWNLRRRRLHRAAWSGHPPGPVVQVVQVYGAASGQACLLMSSGRDGFLRLWRGLLDVASGGDGDAAPICQVAWPSSQLTFCRFAAWSMADVWRFAYVSVNESAVEVRALDYGKDLEAEAVMVLPLSQDRSKPQGMVMTLTGLDTRLLLGYESGRVELWLLGGDAPVCAAHLKMFADSVMCLDYHGGVNRGVAGSVEQELVFFELTEQQELRERCKVTAPNPGFASASWRPDGRIVAVGGWDGRLRLFARSGRALAVLQLHQSTLSALAFSPRDGHLFSGGRDGLLAAWTAYMDVV